VTHYCRAQSIGGGSDVSHCATPSGTHGTVVVSSGGGVTMEEAVGVFPWGIHRRQTAAEADLAGPVAWGLTIVAIALAVFGLAERVWLVNHSPINSDQAVVGLMAKAILHGHFVAFFWGQHYAGVEPYVTAALFALFGSSDTVLNLTPVVLSAAAVALVYLVGRLYLPRVFAVGTALAVWVWPLIGLTNGTQEIGYVFACLDTGLLAVLFATRIRRQLGAERVNWILFGASFGCCIWSSPEFLYFVAPCALLLLPAVAMAWKRERHRTTANMALGILATGVGGLPFWWATATTHFATITHPNTAPYPGTLSTRTTSMFSHALPIAAGLERPYSGAWIGSSTADVAVLVVALIIVVGAGLWSVTQSRRPSVLPLVAFAVVFLVIYPLLPPTFTWQDGRYVVFLPFLLVIVFVYPLGVVAWRRGAIALGLVVLVASAALTTHEISGVVSSFSVTQLDHAQDVNRSSTLPLAAALERQHVTQGYAAYWLAYKLDFESGGALHFTPIPHDNMRNAGYLAAVDHSARPAWIVCPATDEAVCVNATLNSAVNPAGLSATALTSWLTRQGIAYRSTTAEGFTIVMPTVRVTASVLREGGVLGS
jgi:hypothetical protein